jgi:hypothetical protein
MPRTHHNTAAFERGTPSRRRRPLRHEGLATLALRKLNRQSAGVPAALASLPARGAGLSCRMTSVSETGSLALHSEAANYQADRCPAWSNAKLPGRRGTARMKPATHRLEGGFCRTVACTRGWQAVSHCMADSQFLDFAPKIARCGRTLFCLCAARTVRSFCDTSRKREHKKRPAPQPCARADSTGCRLHCRRHFQVTETSTALASTGS